MRNRGHRWPELRATSRWDRVRILIAGGTLLGVGAALTAAAYLDNASVEFSPVGGTYDIAYVDPDGTVHQGAPEPYEIDLQGSPPINEVGFAAADPLLLTLRNTGSTESGIVTLTLASLLAGQPADDDGVVRDPFDVLLVSVWNPDGVLVADLVDPAALSIDLDSWAPGTDRSVTLQFGYRADLGTPYYFGKDVRIGVTAQGTSA